METRQFIISGKVQGVFYRKHTLEKAQELGLSGTVQNRQDDTVEIIATGTPAQLDALAIWCWSGSPRSYVTGVAVTSVPLTQYRNFTIVRD